MNRAPKTLVDPETGDEYGVVWECDNDEIMVRQKKKPKIIDLSPLVGSDVICEFGPEGQKQNDEGRLGKITPSGMYKKTLSPILWDWCRPLLNHPQVYMGGPWPIPEGYIAEKWDSSISWHRKWRPVGFTGSEHIHPLIYRVVGVREGYIEPWQEGE